MLPMRKKMVLNGEWNLRKSWSQGALLSLCDSEKESSYGKVCLRSASRKAAKYSAEATR